MDNPNAHTQFEVRVQNVDDMVDNRCCKINDMRLRFFIIHNDIIFCTYMTDEMIHAGKNFYPVWISPYLCGELWMVFNIPDLVFAIHTFYPLYPQGYTPMKTVIQRVSRAQVSVDGEVTGSIGTGLLVLLGIHPEDDASVIRWMGDKILNMRIFPDEEGKMNRSVRDIRGGILVISQFTLYGDVQRGNRPGFSEAAPPGIAEPVYEEMVRYLRSESDLPVETGKFGAMMDVSLINEGPVTIIVEK